MIDSRSCCAIVSSFYFVSRKRIHRIYNAFGEKQWCPIWSFCSYQSLNNGKITGRIVQFIGCFVHLLFIRWFIEKSCWYAMWTITNQFGLCFCFYSKNLLFLRLPFRVSSSIRPNGKELQQTRRFYVGNHLVKCTNCYCNSYGCSQLNEYISDRRLLLREQQRVRARETSEEKTLFETVCRLLKPIFVPVMMMMSHYPIGGKCLLAPFYNRFIEVLCRKLCKNTGKWNYFSHYLCVNEAARTYTLTHTIAFDDVS